MKIMAMHKTCNIFCNLFKCQYIILHGQLLQMDNRPFAHSRFHFKHFQELFPFNEAKGFH